VHQINVRWSNVLIVPLQKIITLCIVQHLLNENTVYIDSGTRSRIVVGCRVLSKKEQQIDSEEKSKQGNKGETLPCRPLPPRLAGSPRPRAMEAQEIAAAVRSFSAMARIVGPVSSTSPPLFFPYQRFPSFLA
jgi:hypothetical protein